MSRFKRLCIILISVIAVMLIVPLITVNTVKADAGMLVTMLLFFTIYPLLSIILGVISGRDIKFFWFVPILIAGLFWLFSSFTYKTAFPIVYSLIYFALSAISMVIGAVKKHNMQNSSLNQTNE